MYSQPSNDEHSDGSGETADHSTLISIAASYALETIGDKDRVKGQLPPRYHEAFDMAYSVQEVKRQQEGLDKTQRLSMRTEEALEKSRASRLAAERIYEEERAALLGAGVADDEGSGFTSALMSSDDLDDIPDADILVEGFLVKESIVRIYGPPKSYKSFVMLDMAGCIGSGIKWHGRDSEKGRVLYVVAEGLRGIRPRVRAWEKQNGRKMEGVEFYPKAVQIGRHQEIRELIAAARRGGHSLIVFDTQARCTVGKEENSNTEMGVIVAALDVLKEVTGACVALVHHSGANETKARGATTILGALDAEFQVEANKDTMSVTVHTRAQKDLAEAPSIDLELCNPGPGLSLAVKSRMDWYKPTAEDLPPLSDGQARVLGALKEFGAVGASPSAITTEAGWDNKQRNIVQKHLGKLMERGYVHRENANRYQITRSGTARLAITLSNIDGG